MKATFVGQKHDDVFDVLLSAVHVVAQEQVVCLGGKSSMLEKAQQVVELSMSVPANLSPMKWGGSCMTVLLY